MRIAVVLVALVSVAPQAQETKPVPEDSVLIESPGCLKGRVLTGTPRPEGEGVLRGPDINGRHFRLAGPRDVMDLVRRYEGQLVQVVGVVRKASLDDQGVQTRLGRGRVTMGAPQSDPTRMTPSSAAGPGVPTMDLRSVRLLADRCPL